MKIKREVVDSVIQHAKKDAPIEACGYLAGCDELITRNYGMANMDKSTQHFSFDPQEQFNVFRGARAAGLEIYAVYHSHPGTPARPSPEDLKLAYDPNISYVIISLAGGREDIKSFKIKGSKQEPESLEIIDD